MKFADDDATPQPSTVAGNAPRRVAPRFRLTRRALFRYGSGTAIVTGGVGLAGLLELLEHREAIAAGLVIPLVGVTREPNDPEETPHRHTFSVRFRVTGVSPSAIVGDVSGRTMAVISTGSAEEDQHFHLVHATGVELESLILSGPENNELNEHSHLVSLE